MSVNSRAFTNWAAKGAAALKLWARSAPNLVQLLWYLVSCWGGGSLGIYGVRNMRAGTLLSFHSFGAALDWSYRGLGETPDERRKAAAPVIEWLIANSAELGIQAIHDYLNCRIWHSVRAGGPGWKDQPASAATGMGQSWGDWLHIETYEAAWPWNTPIAERLGQPVVVTPVPEPAPGPVAAAGFPSIEQGSTGPLVAVVQTILRERANQDIGNSDGKFGRRTLAGLLNLQAYAGLAPDGKVDGIDDWNTLAWIDKGWDRLYAAGYPKP